VLNRLLVLGLSLLALQSNAPAAGPPRVLRVDDFEDGDRRAASGLSWISVSDDLRGGTSTATLRVSGAGADGSRHALRVSGDVAAGGFAGAWVALDGRSRATDISDFQGVRFRARGQGALQVAVRGGPSPGFNYAAPFEAGAAWTPVEVRFDSLKPQRPEFPPLDLRSIGWMGVSVGAGRSGPYDFEIDDVQLFANRPDAALRVQEGPTLAVHFGAASASELPAGPWTELAKDVHEDGKQKCLPDAIGLSVREDPGRDRIWFRVALSAAMPERWLGVNLALDVDGDPANGMAWWGTNQGFHFDRLVTVWGSEAGGGYQGMLGIADAADVQAGRFGASGSDRVMFVVDRREPAVMVGIPRSALGRGASGPVRVVAAVGSSFAHNDDVPDTGAALVPR
jgi:hypothetical protein